MDGKAGGLSQPTKEVSKGNLHGPQENSTEMLRRTRVSSFINFYSHVLKYNKPLKKMLYNYVLCKKILY